MLKRVGGYVYATAEEMSAIDREAIDLFGIDVLSLMENAGAAVAAVASDLLGGRANGRRVACLTGKGNNGGDGLVASRRLMNQGAEVDIVLASSEDELGGSASRHLATVRRMGAHVLGAGAPLKGYDLLIDALLGYNARGPPRPPIDRVIESANTSGVPILAVDIPSGLDPTSGVAEGPCIVAKATIALGLPKTGFLNPAALGIVGDLYLGDVSIPSRLYANLQQPLPLFGRSPAIRIR